jgi:hypothetical protein
MSFDELVGTAILSRGLAARQLPDEDLLFASPLPALPLGAKKKPKEEKDEDVAEDEKIPGETEDDVDEKEDKEVEEGEEEFDDEDLDDEEDEDDDDDDDDEDDEFDNPDDDDDFDDDDDDDDDFDDE